MTSFSCGASVWLTVGPPQPHPVSSITTVRPASPTGRSFLSRRRPEAAIVGRDEELTAILGTPQEVDQPEQVDVVETLERIVEHRGLEGKGWNAEVQRQEQRHRQGVPLGAREGRPWARGTDQTLRVVQRGVEAPLPSRDAEGEADVAQRWMCIFALSTNVDS